MTILISFHTVQSIATPDQNLPIHREFASLYTYAPLVKIPLKLKVL